MSNRLDEPLAVVNIRWIDRDPRSERKAATLALDVGDTVHPFALVGVGSDAGIHPRWRRRILFRIASLSERGGAATVIFERKSIALIQGITLKLRHKRYGAFELLLTKFTARRPFRASRLSEERRARENFSASAAADLADLQSGLVASGTDVPEPRRTANLVFDGRTEISNAGVAGKPSDT